MSQVSIETPQNVAIDYQLAGVGPRMLATLLDWVVFIGYIFISTMLIGFLSPSLMDSAFMLFVYLPLITYDLYMEILTGGKSIGKLIMKIQVIKVDGTQAGIGDYFLRWIFRIVDSVLYVGTIGLFSIIATQKSQRLGDLAANTTVIRTSQKTRIYDTILHFQHSKNIKITFPEVVALNDRDISIVKELLPIIRHPENASIRSKLVEKVKNVTGVQTSMSDTLFLEHIVRDYSNYDFDRG